MKQFKEYPSGSTGQKFLISLVLIGTGIFAHAVVVVFNVVDTNWDFDAHFAWATQFSEAFRSGNLYPRWMPLGNNGLGEPVMLFYSPLFYFLTSTIDWLPLSSWESMKWASVFSTFVAGLVTWMFMRPMVSAGWALLAAITVQTAPMIFMIYHYFNGYPWGASFAAYALFLLFTLRFFVQGKSQYFPLVSLAALLLILAHIVSSIMVFLSVGLSVVIVACLKSENRWTKSILPVLWWGVGVLLGIGMAWFYLWPALTSLDLVTSENWQNNYPPQDAFAFPTITAFVFGMRWFSFQWVVPGLILASVVLSTIAYRRWARELDSSQRNTVLFLLVLAWVSLFFASELSYPFWLDPSPLLWVQSPHRFTYVSCLPALITNIFWLDKLWNKNAYVLEKLVLLGPVVASLSLFVLLTLQLLNVGASMETLESEPLKPYGSYPEYKTAARTDESEDWVKQGGLQAECRSLGIRCTELPEGYSWEIESLEYKHLRLPVLAFPSWKVTINGTEFESRTDSKTGLIEISVGSSISRVQVFWNRLPQERQGTWVSLIFVAIVLISSVWLRFKSRPDTI